MSATIFALTLVYMQVTLLQKKGMKQHHDVAAILNPSFLQKLAYCSAISHFIAKSLFQQFPNLKTEESIVKQGAKEEYAQLRTEMNSRIEITFSFSHSIIIVVLTLWTISTGLYANVFKEANNNGTFMSEQNWIFAGIQAGIFVITLLLLVPMAAKYGDNVKQITSLSSYIKIFYELPSIFCKRNEMFAWEFESGKLSSMSVDRKRDSFFSKLFTADFFLLGILSSMLYTIFATIAIAQLHKTSKNKIFTCVAFALALILFIISVLSTIIIYKSTRVKSNSMTYLKRCVNVYINIAVDLEIYDDFPFERYLKNTEITREDKIKILTNITDLNNYKY